MTHREGWGGSFGTGLSEDVSFVNNRRTTQSFDAAGNFSGGSGVTYDATGQQLSYAGGPTQSYDGDGVRGKKIESGDTIYYLRSSVLGGQVIAEIYQRKSKNWHQRRRSS